MPRPKRKIDWPDPVVAAVETGAESGAFQIEPRWRIDRVEDRCAQGIATARLSVRTDASFSPADADRAITADRRVIIQTPDRCLFDGYPTQAELNWPREGAPSSGRAKAAMPAAFSVHLEHVVGRLARDRRAWIVGRYARDGRIEDGLLVDPDKWRGASALATALPCIFNADGIANADPEPIFVDNGAGGLRPIHIFKSDGDSGAVSWTWARVIRYLLHFYSWPAAPVSAQDVLSQTDEAALMPPGDRHGISDSDLLARALLAEPHALALEAVNLLEALALIAAETGIYLSASTHRVGGEVRTKWRLWSGTSGDRRDLRLATDDRDEIGAARYSPSDVPVVDLFAANNVSAAGARWDVRQRGHNAVTIGGVRYFELSAELVPGWLPASNLDNVAAPDRSAAKSPALSDTQIAALGPAVADEPWYRRYYRRGAEFDSNRDVGRLWVLNEAGDYAPEIFNRNAPFDEYAAFDFSPLHAGPWLRRRRTLLPLFDGRTGETRVCVEISFDGGASWQRLTTGYRVLDEQAGIWLDADNLLSIAPADQSAVSNLWFALIDQLCRVRVTALIESDDRLRSEVNDDRTISSLSDTDWAYAPERYRFVARPSAADGLPPDARDDTASIDAAAAERIDRAGRAIAARPVIPWLDTEFELGDQVAAIKGRGIRFTTKSAPCRAGAFVLGKRYFLSGGRWETELELRSPSAAAQALDR